VSASGKSSPRHPRLRLAVAIALVVLLGAGAWLAMRSSWTRVPGIDTTGMDPAVARLIESALRDAREQPRSARTWGRLGSALMHYEFTDEARRAFTEAERLDPTDARWPYLHGLVLVNFDAAGAAAKWERAVTLAGNGPDAPRLRLAQWLAERGDDAGAERHFQVLLEHRPGHPPALLGLARLRHAQGRTGEGTNLLARCLNDPHTARAAHALLAATLQSVGQGEAAAAASRRSAALPEDLPWPDPFWEEAAALRVGLKADLERATTLLDRGQSGEALALLNTVTRERPDDDEAWYLTGWALNQTREHAGAERALREHLRRSPGSPKGHAQLAVALLAQRRHPEAIDVLRAGVRLKPTWRELHSNLGYACVQLGRDDEAIGHYRDALACDPAHVPTHAALAELLLRRGARDEARQLLRQALELEPADTRVRALLERSQAGP
jgi:Flp pilus assembly protein TadD